MKRIMFVGPSGIGKTTLAKFIETKYGIPFISGSMSDLMPDIKEMHHAEFLHQECGELINKDYQLNIVCLQKNYMQLLKKVWKLVIFSNH